MDGQEPKERLSALDVSYYTSGWIRKISLYVEMKKYAEKRKKKFTPNLNIGNPPRKY